MGRKANPNNQYFNPTVEQAILDYNATESITEKNKLYSIIYPALSKVSEVYYNKIKPTYMEGDPMSIQLDCLCFLTERLYHIKQGKGKAFSYMSVTARNYYILNNDLAYKKIVRVLPLPDDTDKFDRIDDGDIRNEEKDQTNFKHIAKRQPQVDYLHLIINLLEDIDNIEDFGKRALMKRLKSMHHKPIAQPSITRLLNIIEIHYIAFKKHWMKYGKEPNLLGNKKLTQEQIKYCIDNYIPYDPIWGYVGLAKLLGLDVRLLTSQLRKYNLVT
jgi:hypothetical protein